MKLSRIEVFVEVDQDWYGNFKFADDLRLKDAKFIRVSLLELLSGHWRVCAWGNDDFGLERDFLSMEYDDAVKLYQTIVTTPRPTQQMMRDLGMVGA